MSPWVSVIAVIIICCVGSTLTYAPGVKMMAWYPWVMASLSVVGGLLYGLSAKACASDAETFALSITWDVIAAAVYVIVPVCVFGMRLSPLGWAGLLMALIGVLVMMAMMGRPPERALLSGRTTQPGQDKLEPAGGFKGTM